MEDFNFDVAGILSEDEANQLFEEQAKLEKEKPEEKVETDHAEETAAEESSEGVGMEDNNDSGGDAVQTDGDGSSPSIYSSMASALKKDGIFPDFTDEEIAKVESPEDFVELFNKVIESKYEEGTKRVLDLLNNGAAPSEVQTFERTVSYLESINEDQISAEGEEGDDLRKQIIFNDLVRRGYSDEKARKELEKSFKAGTDVEDAKDALAALTKHYKDEYGKYQEETKKRAEEAKQAQKKQSDDFKKIVLDDEITLGDTKLDKRTRQRVYDAVTKPVYKDPDSGRLMTEVQKFQKEHPLEFLKQLGMWFVLTDGGKNVEGFTKEQARAEMNKGVRELAQKINSTALNRDGSLRYVSGGKNDTDPLMSDGWKVGW